MNDDQPKVVSMDGKRHEADGAPKCAWKLGDKVQLQSGGPVMTVNGLDRESEDVLVLCAWYCDNGHPCEYGYAPEALREPS